MDRKNYKGTPGQKMDSKSKVDRNGYVPMHIKVAQYLNNGLRHGIAKKEHYDLYNQDASYDDAIRVPITRTKGMSNFDILNKQKELLEQLKEAKQLEGEEASEASATADEAEQSGEATENASEASDTPKN